ncbi:MAG: SCP2 sterol-binding domain-containing protein [Anaerolineae bacterium]|nr:SCP2 sterol-binding domain-containing protein [Anaerolineae bacterium]
MAYIFPENSWLQSLKDKLNTDQHYAHVARKWEGDIMFNIEPGGSLAEKVQLYIDLWHGKCRDAFIVDQGSPPEKKATFVLSAPYNNFVRILKGDLDPMQAMVTRKLSVQGSMAYMMRNVPVVLDFVRCAQEIDADFLP